MAISTTPKGTELDNKCFEVAFNYVNICAGSKTEAYRKYIQEHGEEEPKYLGRCAYEFFKHKKVQHYIDQLKAENREKYEGLRDENIAILKAISVSNKAKESDKIAAVKELNNMCGFNAANKIQLSQEKELVIEIDTKEE